MKKDILFEEAKGVVLAILQHAENDWKVYLHNTNNEPITNVLVASHGHGMVDGQPSKTSTLRHMIEEVDAQAHSLIEPISPEVFLLTNEYRVTYYIGNQIFDKNFEIEPQTIDSNKLVEIPALSQKGILIL